MDQKAQNLSIKSKLFVKFQIDFFCMIFDYKIEEKIRGGYAERPKTDLSLLISMVPAGGIEPAPGIHNT